MMNDKATLVSRFQQMVDLYGDRMALSAGDTSWSYREFDRKSDEAAAGLLANGAEAGMKIGIWTGETPEAMMFYMAVLKSGATAVMLNTSWTGQEMCERLLDSDVEMLIYNEGCKTMDFTVISEQIHLPLLRKKIYIGNPSKHFEGIAMETVIADGRKIPDSRLRMVKEAISAADEDAILFTSGSTCRPKAVLTTHNSRLQCALAQAKMLAADENDRYCVAIPMFHCFSMTSNLLAAWMTGAAVVLPQDRKTDHIFRIVQEKRCTILSAVPTLYSALLANKNRENYDISSLRTGIIGGSLYSEAFFKRVCNALHINLISSFGQTEATSCITCCEYNDSLEVRASTLGHFLPGVEGVIKNPKTGEKMPVRQIGEICFKGFNVMKGYYKQPEMTAKTIDQEGFVHTGDLGFIDENGYLHMTGRLKEMIIRGGENIAPGEVECAIMKDNRVAQVKVVGIPDEHYGEEVCACVILNTSADMSADEVKKAVAGQIAAYKVPKYVLFTHVFPLNASGKVDTMAVRKWAVRECESCA